MSILYTFCLKETCLLRKEPYTHRKRIRGVTEGVDLVNIKGFVNIKGLTVSRDFFNGLHFFRRTYTIKKLYILRNEMYSKEFV